MMPARVGSNIKPVEVSNNLEINFDPEKVSEDPEVISYTQTLITTLRKILNNDSSFKATIENKDLSQYRNVPCIKIYYGFEPSICATIPIGNNRNILGTNLFISANPTKDNIKTNLLDICSQLEEELDFFQQHVKKSFGFEQALKEGWDQQKHEQFIKDCIKKIRKKTANVNHNLSDINNDHSNQIDQ